MGHDLRLGHCTSIERTTAEGAVEYLELAREKRPPAPGSNQINPSQFYKQLIRVNSEVIRVNFTPRKPISESIQR